MSAIQHQLGVKAAFLMWAGRNTHDNRIGPAPLDQQIRLAWFRHAPLA